MSTDTEVREIEQVITKPEFKEPGDDEKFSHYARKNDITEAMFSGTPCTALCGKRWVPTRDPEKCPVCPECKEIWEGLQS